MKVILFTIILFISANSYCQKIDSFILKYFEIKTFKIITYNSNLEWEIEINDYFKTLLKRNQFMLSDSIIGFNAFSMPDSYTLQKFKIKNNKISPIDTFFHFRLFDTSFQKTRDEIYSKKGTLSKIVDYNFMGYISECDLYKIIVLVPENGGWWTYYYYDFLGQLCIRGQAKNNRLCGKWVFYNKNKNVEAVGIVDSISNVPKIFEVDSRIKNSSLYNYEFLSYLSNNGYSHFRFYFGKEIDEKIRKFK